MSISDAYEIREFVVLTENTHKYSSTKVESGGGIAGQQTEGVIYCNSSCISGYMAL